MTVFGIPRHALLLRLAFDLTDFQCVVTNYFESGTKPALCKATPKGAFDEDSAANRGEYSDCKNGWFNSIDDSTGHYCIKAFPDLKTFQAADTFCQNTHGGSLVSIHSSKKDQRVQQVARTDLGSKSFYIGYGKIDAGFEWSDGSAANYQNWLGGSPSADAQSKNENCIFAFSVQ